MVNTGKTIGVILNAYRRVEHLEKQIHAVDNQTYKAAKIYVWQNKGQEVPANITEKVVHANCNDNLGVWARFAFALNLDTDYICVLDDDTIPGSKWFENCVTTMSSHDGLLGTRGLQYLSKKRYSPYKDVGWKNPNSEVEKVDIVGHSWFFKREHLAIFWSELPPISSEKTAGEDIHFSYMMQKFGLGTFVPPHPKDDIELWGSLPKYGEYLGKLDGAVSTGDGAMTKFDKVYRYYLSKGFELQLDYSDRLREGVVIGRGLSNNKTLQMIVKKIPYAKTLGRWLVRSFRKLGFHI